MRLWRISSYSDLSGQGAMVAAARWNAVGTPIVYCADHPATALLEILVHIDAEDLPATYQLLEIDVPDTVKAAVPVLPDNWKVNLAATQRIGTDFVNAARDALMEVPCIIVPFTKNYLLSPARLENSGIKIVGTTIHPIDARLLR